MTGFLCGYSPLAHLLYCAKERAGATAFPFTFHLLNRETWGEYMMELDWAPIAMASIKPPGQQRTVVAVGAHGKYYELSPADLQQHIGVLPGFIATNLAVVHDTMYVLGMGRAIARWDGPGTWTRIDPDLPPGGDACGFNDLVGFAADELYTVGWGGEILRTDGERWQAIASPVTAALRAACIGADDQVYAVGYDGTMVRGRGDAWSVIETGRSGVLLDVCAFGDEIFVATAFDVLRLGTGGLEPVATLAEDRPRSCTGLCASADGGAVYWLGGPDLFRITDATWHRVPA